MIIVLLIFLAGIVFFIFVLNGIMKIGPLEKEIFYIKNRLKALEKGQKAESESPVKSMPAKSPEPISEISSSVSEQSVVQEKVQEFSNIPTPPPPPPNSSPIKTDITVAPKPPAKKINWEKFAGEKLFAWIGGFALFLGASFFIKYSIDTGLVSPIIRVIMGFIIGTASVIGGVFLHKTRFKVTSHTLCSVGICILYAFTYAADSFYGLIPTPAVIVIMSLVCATSFLLATRMDSKQIAVFGLIGGFLSPWLLFSKADNAFALFSYIALLDAAIIFVALKAGWPFMFVLSSIATYFFQVVWYQDFFHIDKVNTAFVIFALFPAMFSAGAILAKKRGLENRIFRHIPAAFIVMETFFVFSMSTIDVTGMYHYKVFFLMFIINAYMCFLFYRDGFFKHWHVALTALSFFTLFFWTGNFMSVDNLNWGLLFYLCFGVLNSVTPILVYYRGKARISFWAVLYPLAFLTPLPTALDMAKTATYFLWPVVFILGALGLIFAILTSMAWVGAVSVLLVGGVSLMWLNCLSPVAGLFWFLLITILMAVGFFSLVTFMSKRFSNMYPEWKGQGSLLNVSLFSLLIPFVLICFAVFQTRPESPLQVYAFTFALAAIALGVVRKIKTTDMVSLIVLLGTYLVQIIWFNSSFSVDSFNVSMYFGSVGFMALFLAFPFVFKRDMLDKKYVWITAALSGLSGFHIIYLISEQVINVHYLGIIPAVFAVLYLVVTLNVMKFGDIAQKPQKIRASSFLGVTLFFITLIFPVQFNKEWITIGLALEGVALIWLFTKIDYDILKKWGYVLLTISFVRLCLNPAILSYHPRESVPIVNWYLYAYAIVSVAMYVAAKIWKPVGEKVWQTFPKSVLMAFGTILLFLLVNIQIADYFSTGTSITFQFSGNLARDMSYTIAWGLFAAVLFGVGISKKLSRIRFASVALFAVTILKLFFHDLWSLGQLYRVFAFVVMALLLIAVSFFYQKFIGAENEKNTVGD
jgi:uncharacterized membrane protein